MNVPEPSSRLVLRPSAAESRPRSVAVLGILNICFGILGFVCLPLGIGLLLVAARNYPDDPQLNRVLIDRNYRVFILVSSVVFMAIDASLIMAGAGLLRWRSWGRQLSLTAAIGALILHPISMVLDYLLQGHSALIAAARAPDGDAFIEELVAQIMVLAIEVIGMIYPAFLLYFLTRKKLERAFHAD